MDSKPAPRDDDLEEPADGEEKKGDLREFRMQFQVVDLKRQVREITKSFDETKTQLRYAKKRMKELNDKLHGKLGDGQYLLDENGEELIVIRKDASMKLHADLDSCRKQLADKIKENIGLTEDKNALESRLKVAKENLTRTEEELKAHMEVVTKTAEDRENEKKKILQEKEREVNNLGAIIAQSEISLSISLQEKQRLQQEISVLKEVISTLEASVNELSNSCNGENAEMEALKKQNDVWQSRLKETVETCEQEKAALRSDLQQIKLLLRDTDYELSQAEQKFGEMQLKYEEEFVENEELQKENEMLSQSLKGRDEVIMEIKYEITSLEECLQNTESKYGEAMLENEKLQGVLNKLKESEEKFQKEIEEVCGMNAQLKIENGEKLKENKKLKTEIRKLNPQTKQSWKM